MIIQIRNFIPRSIAIAASNAIPDENWQWWHRYNNKNSIKYGSTDHLRFPNSCRIALEEIGRNFLAPWNSFPDFDYHAGGIHMLPPGGWLSGHYDAEYHPLFSWKRVGSLVWFANQEWKNEWGGHLIVDKEVVVPEFNKLIYFNTDKCWHEVTKITGPEYRKTLALFYWEKVDFIPENVNKSANFEGMK
jgi:Rps23 Pro-64 3,4-dihydroxylase Tpa1-like proline 4-hydroxylase